MIPNIYLIKEQEDGAENITFSQIDETIDFKDFTLRNKDNLIKGKGEISKAHNSYIHRIRSNMEEYKRKLRMQLKIETKTYKRKR